ncbi:XRE family transcriptional regulator [Leeia sp. TBRC 13508]|uniref:XRE family transcriptional regulator n=1 Tax=Leeia speluncae TaxID=2884804 RepID=A0ABS8DA58_9NEIS|nr:XRE family transcriptional regulator [Leeia speluncae]MCB6185094.1 XRE family transcriptional regulator [Leeia speluncae]
MAKDTNESSNLNVHTVLDDGSTSLGEEVRKLRKARGKSLLFVATAIGRSVSFVSQVERGQAEPSIADLKAIAKTLGVPFGWFFLSEATPNIERGKIVRSDVRRKLGTVTDGLIEELLSPNIGGGFEMFLSTFEPGASLTEPTTRATEEEGYVVSGCLNLWIDEQFFQVSAGDSFRIANQSFRWDNPHNAEAVVVWVIAPPVY